MGPPNNPLSNKEYKEELTMRKNLRRRLQSARIKLIKPSADMFSINRDLIDTTAERNNTTTVELFNSQVMREMTSSK